MGQSANLEASQAKPADNGGLWHGVEDFFHAAAYSAIQAPINGIEQLADHILPIDLPKLDLISAPADDSLWTSAGKLTGAVLDFALLQKGLSAAAPGMFGAGATSSVWLRSGLTGAAYQMIMPTSDNGNYFANKARDLGIGFGTFAAMGAISQYVAPKLGSSLLGRVEAGAEGGLVGGTADAALTDALYMEKPTFKDLGKIANYTAFGAMLGATSYFEDAAREKWNSLRQQTEAAATGGTEQSDQTTDKKIDPLLQQSIENNQGIFNQSPDDVVPATKQLYEVRFRKVTAADGESVPTLENPGGEQVAQGHWVAQRLDDAGQPVYEHGQLNQWPISESKIAKTYQVDPDTLANQAEFVAPTRTDGPPVYMVQLKQPVTIQTSWGTMNGNPGDWLANYDYNAGSKSPGQDYAIVSSTSFDQTYQRKSP